MEDTESSKAAYKVHKVYFKHRVTESQSIQLRYILFLVAMLWNCATVKGQSKVVERTTDVLCVVPSFAGICLAISNDDGKGAVELGLSTATTLVANYALEAAIKKDRPDGTGSHAFPSTHTALAFDGSTFLMKRYGWEWGIPAYAVSAYVAWGRTHADKHDWWDVIGGAAIGAGAALIYTTPFGKNTDLSISPALLDGNGKGLCARLRF